MECLGIDNPHEFDNLMITAICNGLIRGRIDEKNKLLRVDYAKSRDLVLTDLNAIAAKLDKWSANCESSLKQIVNEMQNADKRKMEAKDAADNLAAKVAEAKQALKTSAAAAAAAGARPSNLGVRTNAPTDEDDSMPTPVRPEKKHKGRKGRDEL